MNIEKGQERERVEVNFKRTRSIDDAVLCAYLENTGLPFSLRINKCFNLVFNKFILTSSSLSPLLSSSMLVLLAMAAEFEPLGVVSSSAE